MPAALPTRNNMQNIVMIEDLLVEKILLKIQEIARIRWLLNISKRTGNKVHILPLTFCILFYLSVLFFK